MKIPETHTKTRSYGLEIKTEEKGSCLSPTQIATQQLIKAAAGVTIATAYGLDEAVRTLESTRADKAYPHRRAERGACVLARPAGPSNPKTTDALGVVGRWPFLAN
jgi:hypothetical protein